jgi:hypothetical protein
MFRNFALTVLCTVLLAVAAQSDNARADERFRLVVTEIGYTQAPQGAPEVAKEMLNNEDLKAAAIAVAAYYGVDPQTSAGWIEAARQVVNANVKQKGEQHWGEVAFDEGYSICRVLKADSTASNCGSDHNTNIGGTDGHRLSYYMHVPQANAGGGQCWAYAKFLVLLVKKSEKASADCSANNDRVLFCDGKKCDHGPGVDKF